MACLVDAGVTVGRKGACEDGGIVLSALGVSDSAGVKVGEGIAVMGPQPDERARTSRRKNFRDWVECLFMVCLQNRDSQTWKNVST